MFQLEEGISVYTSNWTLIFLCTKTMSKIFEAAILYKKAGRDVIPVHPIKKYPFGIIGWEKKPFTEEELRKYILDKGWGIGIRNQEGLDFDNKGEPSAKKAFDDWKALVYKIQPGLVDRLLIETTQHEGFHVCWDCDVIEENQKLASRPLTDEERKEYPKAVSFTFIETRGKGGQFVVSPTPDYSLIQGNWAKLPKITPDERLILIECARALNLLPKNKVASEPNNDNATGDRPGDIFNREGITESLELLKQAGWKEVFTKDDVTYLLRPGKDNGVSATFGYVAPGIFYNFSSNGAPFELNKAYTPFAVFTLLKHQGNFSPAASELAKRYGIKEKDVKKDKSDKSEEKKLYIADFPELVELVADQEKTRFLTFDGKITDQIQIEEQVFYPPEEVLWLLPDGQEVLSLASKHSDIKDNKDGVYGCTHCSNSLYPSILEYFKQFSEMLTEYHYHFLTQMVFHSYLIEKFNYSPILFLVGDGGRGKTPTLKAFAYIARRGIFTETFREANIIRWGGDYKASLFFDTKNFPRRVELANCEDLIYGRAERGVISSRVLFPERGAFQDMKNFSNFGVTAATSNYMVDELTEMRCVVFHMPFSTKVFNIDATPELGLDLKNELTAFRLAHFNKPFVNLEKPAAGKMENYLIGIHQMIKTHFPKYETDYLKFKEEIKEEKFETAENSFSGRIVKLIDSLKSFVENGTLCLTYEGICSQYNKNTTKEIYPKSMSSILKGLGFKTRKNAASTLRGIFYDESLIAQLKEHYGIKVHHQTSSEPSGSSGEKPSQDSNEKGDLHDTPPPF